MSTNTKTLLHTTALLCLLVGAIASLSSCSDKSGGKNAVAADDNAKCATQLYNAAYTTNDEFEVDTTYNADGYYCVNVVHKYSPSTDFYRLYSPCGNLLLIAAGASECAGISGYALQYADGKTASVTDTGMLDEEEYSRLTDNATNAADLLKRWYDKTIAVSPSFTLEYDGEGQLTGIQQIAPPNTLDIESIEVSIDEVPDFWVSDINGGAVLFHALYKESVTDGSSLAYLYADGQLVAELAYWKGTFIKTRTYNRYGQMIAVYNDREADPKSTAWYDRDMQTEWYAAK